MMLNPKNLYKENILPEALGECNDLIIFSVFALNSGQGQKHSDSGGVVGNTLFLLT